MLHTITALTQDSIWQVGWRLRNEIYTNTLRAYQTHNLLNLVGQSLRCILEKHMCLVKEEYHLRQLHISNLWHLVVNLGQEPHQECGV